MTFDVDVFSEEVREVISGRSIRVKDYGKLEVVIVHCERTTGSWRGKDSHSKGS